MVEKEQLTCVICELPVDNPNDEICSTCADDIRTEEGAPADGVVVDPVTGKVYAAWGYSADVPILPPPPLPDQPRP